MYNHVILGKCRCICNIHFFSLWGCFQLVEIYFCPKSLIIDTLVATLWVSECREADIQIAIGHDRNSYR